MSRIIFSSSEWRNEFFKKIKQNTLSNTWSPVIKELKLSRTLLEKYRYGILTLPEKIYIRLKLFLSISDRKIFDNHIKIISDNWGAVEGGKITYKNHHSFFEEGRKKGIESIKRRQVFIDISLPLSKDLSYFIGLFIGDGFTNKYGHHYQTQFTGHRSKEEIFYLNYFIPLVSRLFDIKPYIKREKNSDTIRINFYSKYLYEIITKRFGIKPGVKFSTVLIPSEVLLASRDIKLACLAGIYDAEACVFFDKRKFYNKSYPRIDLHMQNPAILLQINSILIKEGIKTSFSNKGTHLLIYGCDQIKKFCSLVSLHNPKYLTKLSQL
jgi:hypothetical protein